VEHANGALTLQIARDPIKRCFIRVGNETGTRQDN